ESQVTTESSGGLVEEWIGRASDHYDHLEAVVTRKRRDRFERHGLAALNIANHEGGLLASLLARWYALTEDRHRRSRDAVPCRRRHTVLNEPQGLWADYRPPTTVPFLGYRFNDNRVVTVHSSTFAS